MQKERNISVDIAKGIGIILVVFGHIHNFNFVDLGFTRVFVYVFHVPLFFFLSGVFFNYTESLADTCKKKFLRLYLPFILANLLYLGMELALGKRYECSEIWKIIGGMTTIDSAGPTWFLIVLFRVFILYKLADVLFRDNRIIMTVLACFLGILGTVVTGHYWIGQTMVAFCFFHLGRVSRSALPYIKEQGLKPKIIILSVLAFIIFLCAKYNGIITFVWGMYGNKVLFFLGSIAGIAFTLILSDLLTKTVLCRKVLSNIGKETLPILVFHFLGIWSVVKIMDYIYPDGMTALKVLLCLVSGVGIPYFLSVIYTKLKNRLRQNGA